jgi:hypothetical protein
MESSRCLKLIYSSQGLATAMGASLPTRSFLGVLLRPRTLLLVGDLDRGDLEVRDLTGVLERFRMGDLLGLSLRPELRLLLRCGLRLLLRSGLRLLLRSGLRLLRSILRLLTGLYLRTGLRLPGL